MKFELTKSIGQAIWLLLWCFDKVTSEYQENGIVWGKILGSKPLTEKEIAKDLDTSIPTIKRWIRRLKGLSLIRTIRTPYGIKIEVKNSRKNRVRSIKNDTSGSAKNDTTSNKIDTSLTKNDTSQIKNSLSNIRHNSIDRTKRHNSIDKAGDSDFSYTTSNIRQAKYTCLNLSYLPPKIITGQQAKVVADAFCGSFRSRWCCDGQEFRSVCVRHWKIITEKLQKQIQEGKVENLTGYCVATVQQYIRENSDEIRDEVRQIEADVPYSERLNAIGLNMPNAKDHFTNLFTQFKKQAINQENYWTYVNNAIRNLSSEQMKTCGDLARKIWKDKDLCQK